MEKNLIETILLENLKKNSKKLSASDLNLVYSCRLSLNIQDWKEIFSNTEYIQLIDLSYNNGTFLENILLLVCQHHKINIVDTFDFFFSQIEKANSLKEVLPFSLNHALLTSVNYNKLEATKYLLHSNNLPFKADISHFGYGSLFNAYHFYKKGKTEIFIYLNEQYDYLNDKDFIKCAKENFKKSTELDELMSVMRIFHNIKDIQAELDKNISPQSIKIVNKHKI